MAPGAESAQVDVLRADSGCHQLVAADGPKVEVVLVIFVSPELRGDLAAIVPKLRAAGPERRTDAGKDVAGVAPKFFVHGPDGSANDAGHAAAPPGVDIGHDLAMRIIQQHRLTVGHLHRQKPPSEVGDQRIHRRG